MINQVQKDKYTIAWFKIADYVAKGEKERALGMYRLLAHSIDDLALALQVEADILWAFSDPMAFNKYQEAAQQYQKEGRLQQAAAVYEHILLHARDSECRSLLIDMYKQLNMSESVARHTAEL